MILRGTAPASLKVLHVIADMNAETGGPPVVCAGLAAALTARGHRITIATLHQPGLTPLPLAKDVELVSFTGEGWGRYPTSRRLARWLIEHVASYDIVHLHSVWQFPTYAAARACWAWRVPYVVLLNGMLENYAVFHRSQWVKRLYWHMRERHVEGRSRGIHCLNFAEIRRAVSWINGLPKFVVGNGIASSEIASLPERGRFRAQHPEIANRPLVLFLSRIHPKKGLDRLIPAWKAFVERVPDALFAIAGTGEPGYLAHLDSLILQAGLSGKIIRVGMLVGPAKWEALVDADLFVLPSHQEGFSMAITEALAAGCAPVVTEECNFDELREHGCGIIIPKGDMSAFVDAAVQLLGDEPRRRAMAESGRRFVQDRCTWETVAQDLEYVYRWICADHALDPQGQDIWRPRPLAV